MSYTINQIIEAREGIHAALLALPRAITYSAVADAAGISRGALQAFRDRPERSTLETVVAIGEVIERLTQEDKSND
jgi:hypothetical protein